MKKTVILAIGVAFAIGIFGGLKAALADNPPITWTELKCKYLPDHPACKGIQKPPVKVPDDKNAE